MAETAKKTTREALYRRLTGDDAHHRTIQTQWDKHVARAPHA